MPFAKKNEGAEITPFVDKSHADEASPVAEGFDTHEGYEPTEEDYERAKTEGAAKPVPPGAVGYN